MARLIQSIQSWRMPVLFFVVGMLVPLPVLNAQDVALQSIQGESIRNKLQPFAGAYKTVSQIHTTYEQRIIQSKDQVQADALQQEANQKMNQAVADHGLTIEDYNTIFLSIQSDPALQEEFLTVLRQTP